MNVDNIDPKTTRENDHQIHPMFLERWSPRAMAGTPVSTEQINTLIDAARWAPSCFNAQPWRFASVLPETKAWDDLFGTLAEANQAWVARAGGMIAIASRKTYEHNDQPAQTHSFDAGAAWMSIALQAKQIGLVAHGMAGFDQTSARQALKLPEAYDLPAIIAVGHPGNINDLAQSYQDREQPSPRKPLSEILFCDDFSALNQ